MGGKAPVSSDNSASADKAGMAMFWLRWPSEKKGGTFLKKRGEVCLVNLSQWAQAGRQRSQAIRPDHQIFNDTDQQSPQRGVKVDFSRPSPQTEPELDLPLTLIIFALWRTLTGSDGLVALGLRYWLLHVRDHQVGGGEELVCGHHQPDRAAAHHHVLCWVSRVCVCMFLGFVFFFFWCSFDSPCWYEKQLVRKWLSSSISFALNVKWKWELLYCQQHHRFLLRYLLYCS